MISDLVGSANDNADTETNDIEAGKDDAEEGSENKRGFHMN